jgi:hypothetical protein
MAAAPGASVCLKLACANLIRTHDSDPELFDKRNAMRRLSKLAAAALLGLPLAASAADPVIEVYKSATCGCCKEWVRHLQDKGFRVNVHEVANPSDYRQKFGIPDQYGSCHSATVQGYALEGHVPASDIRRLLASRPKAKGLAVPAMPMGSPGLEGPRKDPYDVYLVQDGGNATVYRHVE